MNLSEALNKRAQVRTQLIGRQISSKFPGRKITEVIVSPPDIKSLNAICTSIWRDHLPNEVALSGFPIDGDNYDVFVVSYRWPAEGDLFWETLSNYQNSIT